MHFLMSLKAIGIKKLSNYGKIKVSRIFGQILPKTPIVARDKTAEEGKAILEAAERVEEFTVELSDKAVRVAAERS